MERLINNPQKNFFNHKDFLYFLIIGVLFYILNQYSIFAEDDYFYTFIGGFDGQDGAYVPVSSWKDAFFSQIYAYFHQNGRFIIHCIIQYICGTSSFITFRIINTIIFVGTYAGIIYMLKAQGIKYKSINIVTIFFLFLLLPHFGRTCLGNVSFTINYLWTSFFTIWFLNLYLHLKFQANPPLATVCYCLYAFFCGSLQESFSIGIAGALFLYHIKEVKRLNPSLRYLLISFAVGACIGVLSPANFNRFEGDSMQAIYTGVLKYIRNFSYVLIDSKALLILLGSSIFIVYKEKKKFITEFIRPNFILIVSIIINLVFITFITYNGIHQTMCINLFSIILLIQLTYIYILKNIDSKIEKRISISLSLLLLLLYIPIIRLRITAYQGYSAFLQSAKDSHNHIAYSTQYEEIRNKYYKNYLYQNYTQTILLDNSFHKQGLSLILSKGNNKEQIQHIYPSSPKVILQECNQQNLTKEKNIFYSHQYGLFIVKINNRVSPISFYAESSGSFLGNLKNAILKTSSPQIPIKTDELDYILKEDAIYYIIRQISFDAKTGKFSYINAIKTNE